MKLEKDPLEAQIQAEIERYLKIRDWLVKSTHGNMYQSGFPDLFTAHTRYGTRWIEVKRPKGYRFTPAQLRDFSLFSAQGVGIYILTAATEEEYKKLFRPANWQWYLSELKI